jgi:hypothetical protein
MMAKIILTKRTSGAKARFFCGRFCGTTEVVPFYKTSLRSDWMKPASFVASNESLDLMEGITA